MKRQATPRKRTAAVPDPATDGFPPQLVLLHQMLTDPIGRETRRRQLIDGRAGRLEPLLWKLAEDVPLGSRPPERGTRFYRDYDEYLLALQGKPIEAPHPAAAAKGRERSSGDRGAGEGVTAPGTTGQKAQAAGPKRIAFEKVKAEVWKWAHALVTDPEYLDALFRRNQDGRALQMLAMLLRFPERAAKHPAWQAVGKRPLAIIGVSFDPKNDPMAEQTQKMAEAQLQEDEELLRRQAQPEQQTATTSPEEATDPDELEVVRLPGELPPILEGGTRTI